MKELEISPIKDVWSVFKQLSNIPRGSGNEKAVSDYAVLFAQQAGVYAKQDKNLNIYLSAPASKGYEKYEPVVLQAHLDMVTEKDSDVEHDFLKDPLKLYIEDGFLKAKGTTLGADDGIGVAMLLALLADKTKKHPPLEGILTVEEETTMKGAKTFDYSQIKSKKLISLDHNTADEIFTSSATLVKVNIEGLLNYTTVKSQSGAVIKIFGLLGGHSGDDILKRKSAFEFTARILNELVKHNICLVKIDCGNAINAIARESTIEIALNNTKFTEILNITKQLEKAFNEELKGDTLSFSCTPKENINKIATDKETMRINDFLMSLPNGAQTILEYPNCAESSLNIGKLLIENGNLLLNISVRSSVLSLEELLLEKLQILSRVFGLELKIIAKNPNFKLNLNSGFIKLFQKVFKENYGKDIKLQPYHAGAEPGVFMENIKGLEIAMISPTLIDIHSPKERLDIKSTEHMYEYLCKVLEQCKF